MQSSKHFLPGHIYCDKLNCDLEQYRTFCEKPAFHSTEEVVDIY